MPAKPVNKNSKTVINILLTGLLTGTLDGLAALLLNYKIKPGLIFKFIASGFFGKAAFSGGGEMVAAGLLFHYLIAFAFSAVLYLLYPFFYNGLRNKYLVACIYGLATWLIMNMVIVPFSKIGRGHIKLDAILTGMLVLIICIGLPVALMDGRQYKNNRPVQGR